MQYFTSVSNALGPTSTSYICKLLNGDFGEVVVDQEVKEEEEEHSSDEQPEGEYAEGSHSHSEDGSVAGPKLQAEASKEVEQETARFVKLPSFGSVRDPAQLASLSLIGCQCDSVSLNRIIRQLPKSETLQRLSLQKMNLSACHLQELFKFVGQCSLTQLDIAWNKVPKKQLALLFDSLAKNRTLEYLNLGWIQMGGVSEESFDKYLDFIKENHRLIHLDMTAVNLAEKQMAQLLHSLKKSLSLHCVHLCGNNLRDPEVQLLNQKLKPTLINNMLDPEDLQRKHQQIK